MYILNATWLRKHPTYSVYYILVASFLSTIVYDNCLRMYIVFTTSIISSIITLPKFSSLHCIPLRLETSSWWAWSQWSWSRFLISSSTKRYTSKDYTRMTMMMVMMTWFEVSGNYICIYYMVTSLPPSQLVPLYCISVNPIWSGGGRYAPTPGKRVYSSKINGWKFW